MNRSIKHRKISSNDFVSSSNDLPLTNIYDLPTEMLRKILSFLNVVDIYKCVNVSK